MGNQFIGTTEKEQRQILDFLGFGELDSFYNTLVPIAHQHPGILASLGKAKSEAEVKRIISRYASQNTFFDQAARFLGAGLYPREIPDAVGSITGRGEWMTPYTPYQAEISQGILLTLFDFQSYMAELTGMKVVNAGMYNGINALVEAMLMACRITGKKKVAYSGALNPAAVFAMQTYAKPAGIELVMIPTTDGKTTAQSIDEIVDEETAAVIIQTPNFWGIFDGMNGQAEVIHAKKALYTVFGGGDQISLALLKTPASYGADIYAGEGQHFGAPPGRGGPHVGILGILDSKYVRELPGRLVLQGEDLDGIPSWLLGIQRREQHITRENATSNACTAETLIAVMVTAYMAIMGPQGLRQAAIQSHDLAHYIAKEIVNIPGFNLAYPNAQYFNETAIITPKPARMIVDKLSKSGILPGVAIAREFPYANSGMENVLLLTATELNNDMNSIDNLRWGLKQYAATS